MADKCTGVPVGLVTVSLKFRRVGENTPYLFEVVQMVLSYLDFVDVAKYTTDLFLESLPAAEHSLCRDYSSIGILI